MDAAQSMARRRQAFWWVCTLFNPLTRSILRSPLHWGMSRRLLLITFPGRKSGKLYTAPISYVQHSDTLLLGASRCGVVCVAKPLQATPRPGWMKHQ